MRAALLLCLLALEVSAQGRLYDRACGVSSRRSSRGGVACSCSNIVPACTPGKQNLALYSQNFAHATWTKISGNGPAEPVITTTNTTAVYAPDCTYTAEEVTFPAVSGVSKYSLLRQAMTLSAEGLFCVWVRKKSGGDKLWVSNGRADGDATDCAPRVGVWSQCCSVASTAGTVFDIGGNAFNTEQTTASMPSGIVVYLWQGDAWNDQAAPAPGSIATEGTAVTCP